MRYFIGYLIKGEAAIWHTEVAKKISEKFNTWKIHEKIPPHITIFYPEGVEDITDIRNCIKNWVKNNRVTGAFHINDVGRFDDQVVFAKIETDESIRKSIENLRESIRKISFIKNESFLNWRPHATLAHRVSVEEINKIWEFVSELDKPNFTLPFDNITIFKYLGDRQWVATESFDLLS